MNTARTSEEQDGINELHRQFSVVGFHGDIKDKLSRIKLSTDKEDDEDESIASDDQSPYSMTEDVLRQRAKKKHYGNWSNQLYACFTLTLGSISNGFTIGSTSPKMRKMYNTVQESKTNAHFAAMVALGLGFGNIFLTILSVNKGPRKVMLVSAPINFLACLIMPIMNTENFQTSMMFFCAFFSIGYMSCGAILLTDIIHEAFFFLFFLIFQSGHGVGIMLAYIFGLSPDLEYYADGLAALILSVFFLALFYLPESPVFVYQKNPMAAEATLIHFRGRDDIQITMRHIAKDYNCRILNINTKYMLLHKCVYKAMIIIAGVAVLEIFYMYHIFLMYNVSMWSTNSTSDNLDVIGQFEDGIVFGVCYYVIPLFTRAINLRGLIGIRKRLLISAVTMPITLVALVVFFYMMANGNRYTLNNQWIRFVLCGMHTLFFNFGHVFCIETLISDYLPEQIQAWASVGILSLRHFILSLALSITFMLESQFATHIILSFFAFISLAGVPFCYYFIVEPTGKTLQQIQLEIGGNPIGTRSSFRNSYRRYLESKEYQF